LVEKNGHWWDKLGEPQYGDEMVVRASRNIVNFDPYFMEGLTNIYGAWLERLVADDWTQDPTSGITIWRGIPHVTRKATWRKAGNFPTRQLT